MSRIMIVDDDATIQIELTEYLNLMDYDVVAVADNGERAVSMARETKPDLILMDVVMPGGIDGITAAERIKENLDAAVVFVTGYDDPEYVERAKAVEPFGYLMKPFDEREIKGVVELSLHKRAMELELARTNEALQKARHMESLCDLAGGISHDYNNLLAVIMGNLSLVMEDRTLKPETRELLGEIEKASLLARDLTRRMMTLTKGAKAFKWINGSINSLVSGCLERFMAHGHHECRLSLPDILYPVRHDPVYLEQVLVVVLTNALEAMPAGGILTVLAKNLELDDGDDAAGLMLKPGKYVKIAIQDQGSGISPKDLPRVFDPYFSTKGKGTEKGMGLGLAIAYAVMEKHGGLIDIHSQMEKGTSVDIYLPAVAVVDPGPYSRVTISNSLASEHNSAIRNPQSAMGRVLLMDDEPMLRRLGALMLARLGYECQTAPDGDRAISAYEKAIALGKPFDVVMLDLTVKGGMGGREALLALKARDPNVRAIVCSGYSEDPVLERFAEYGFSGRLAKPYQKRELKEALKRAQVSD